jgi:hypothetical protein
MKDRRKYSLFGGLILIIAMLGACTSTPESTRTTTGAYEPPEWVMKGPGAFEDSNGKVFYGVGSATGIKNFSLQRTAADDRARNDLAKTFKLYTASLGKDYQASITEGDFTPTSEEQNVEVVIKTLTDSTITGIMIIDHWEHPGRNQLFSLARLDLKSFKKNLDEHKELSKEVREAIKERADKLHEELEQEVLKKEGKS